MTSTSQRPLLRRGWRRRPPRVAEAAAVALGVHEGDRGTPGYVPRPADADLAARVDRGPLVVAHGPRLAGTSRALVHAARCRLPDPRVVRFPEAVRCDPRRLVDEATTWVGHCDGVVLWLDDAHQALLARIDHGFLATVPDGVRLLVTARRAVVGSGALPEPAREALADHGVPVDPDPDSPASPAPRDHLTLRMARARAQLLPEYRRVPTVALLRAAIDWDRLQVPFPLGRDLLRRLALLYCNDFGPMPLAERDAAVDALLDSLGRGWLTVSTRDGRPHHRPHPLLTAAAEDPDVGWSPSDDVWRVYGDLPPTALGPVALAAGRP
ncbi:hypothetical protein ACR9E3_16285 [Actinomycetospora sp. C-140]